MNEKTFKLLEFDVIRSQVANSALSEEARDLILKEEPLIDKEGIKAQKILVSAVMDRLLFMGGEVSEELPAISEILPKLDLEGFVPELYEFYAIMIFIFRAENLRQWLTRYFKNPLFSGKDSGVMDNKQLLLTEIANSLPDCKSIAVEISKIIDKEGKLRDLPELRAIRRRIQSLQKDIESAGYRYAKSEETRKLLQSEIPSMRDGRMVLAVKANFRGRIRGIVHEVSSTGQTVFIEPEEVVEKNNELLIENRRLEAEIRRILRELCDRVRPEAYLLRTYQQKVLYLETIRAKARYSYERKHLFAEDNGSLVLNKARHPLLGRKAVPLDLFMAEDIRTVIITGTNTGGKTVALKTLGLLAMMNQFGLALPVDEGTCLPVFDGIFADIGDEQSISQSLSTFSSHMTNIADIVSNTTENSLVLLDELGSGTDPEEGSAIAMAILDYFIEQNSRLIITTHHGILKNYGYTRKGVENASMEFNSKTLSPTFKIVMGIPGESRALDIAYRNGFPQNIVDKARTYLDDERSDVSALIAGLKDKHRELDQAVQQGKLEEEKLLEERRIADLKELRLKQKELQLKTEAAGNLKKLLSESRKTLENLVREVKEGDLSREKTLKVKEFLSDLEDSVKKEDEALAEEQKLLHKEKNEVKQTKNEEGIIKFTPGMDVLVGAAKRPGRIIRLDKKASDADAASWIVEVGSLKLSISEAELIPSINTNDTKNNKSMSWAADLAPQAPVFLELKVLGMRLNDALDAVNRQIDAAMMGGLKEFAIVHGKGDGILSNGVQNYLKNDPRVKKYHFSRPEIGGHGRTEVVLL